MATLKVVQITAASSIHQRLRPTSPAERSGPPSVGSTSRSTTATQNAGSAETKTTAAAAGARTAKRDRRGTPVIAQYRNSPRSWSKAPARAPINAANTTTVKYSPAPAAAKPSSPPTETASPSSALALAMARIP